MNDDILKNIGAVICNYIDNLEKHGLLKPEEVPEYESLPICIVEDVFSLRAKHKVTDGIVNRFRVWALCNNRIPYLYTLSEFLEDIKSLNRHLQEQDLMERFADDINAHQCTAGVNHHLKTSAVYEFAEFLHELGIETKEDVQKYKNERLLQVVVRGVWGISEAGYFYFKMLTGDKHSCKPDVHILNFIDHAIKYSSNNKIKSFSSKNISGKDCQKIFSLVLESLNSTEGRENNYGNIRHLDYSIWLNREKWSDNEKSANLKSINGGRFDESTHTSKNEPLS